MFEVKPGTDNCPFCNFVIPPPQPGADDPVPVDEHGAPLEQAAGSAVPVPDPEAMLLEGSRPPDPDPMSAGHGAEAYPPEPAPAAAGKPGGGAVQYVVIAVAGFLAFKLGLLDNLLMMTGLMSPPAPPPSAALIEPPREAPGPAAKPSPVLLSEPVQPGSGGPIATEQPAEPAAPPPAAEWSFEGNVYDMLSFKPVNGVVLLFMTQSEEETFEGRTDARGRFKIVLPVRSGGYKLIADHPEYIGEYFDETTPPIRTWSLAKRRQMRAARPSHAPWASKDGAPVRRDFVMFPDITDR